ncbi:MAG TPA: c-type cytochrome [Vicinamibacterales bacterium]|nr:c-type cytochrome [Vicinamibacterales bacterium]
MYARVAAIPLLALPLSMAGSAAPADKPSIARGRYIVEDVVQCWRCHTPQRADGTPDRERWLAGGPVPYASAKPVENWAVVAPRLAGLPPGTDAEIVRLLTTGIARTGQPPRPPMLQFHMTRSDAQAVLAYLKSMPPE